MPTQDSTPSDTAAHTTDTLPATGNSNLFLGPTWPETKFGRLMVTGFGHLLAAAARGGEFLRNCGVEVGVPAGNQTEDEALARWIDARQWPAIPLQISLYQPGAWADSIVAAKGVFLPQWLESDVPDVLSADLTDALVRRTADGFEVITRENSGREAMWFDWANERPLSYPGVFPVRVDCARVTIKGESTDPLLVRLLTEAAALCARVPNRLTLDDRIHGRNVGWANPTRSVGAADTDPLTIVIRSITDTLSASKGEKQWGPSARTASRLLSAWAVSAHGVEQSIVRAAAECAWNINRDEAETALRVACVRLSQLEDAAGIAALEHAATLLSTRASETSPEHAEFVLNELKTQSDTPEGIARVCSGIVLVCASMPAEHLRHFKQDLLDDVRVSGVLIGQDQDAHLILQVFRMLERRAGVAYIPAARAAPKLVLTPPGLTFPKNAKAKRKTAKARKATRSKPAAKIILPFKQTKAKKQATPTQRRRAA